MGRLPAADVVAAARALLATGASGC